MCVVPVVSGAVVLNLSKLRTESLCGPSLGFGGLFFAVLRRRCGFERVEKTSRHAGYFFHGVEKRGFIGLRRFVETADLPHKLQGSGANLVLCYGRIEVEQGLDV